MSLRGMDCFWYSKL